jgi:hypothetical protein
VIGEYNGVEHRDHAQKTKEYFGAPVSRFLRNCGLGKRSLIVRHGKLLLEKSPVVPQRTFESSQRGITSQSRRHLSLRSKCERNATTDGDFGRTPRAIGPAVVACKKQLAETNVS